MRKALSEEAEHRATHDYDGEDEDKSEDSPCARVISAPVLIDICPKKCRRHSGLRHCRSTTRPRCTMIDASMGEWCRKLLSFVYSRIDTTPSIPSILAAMGSKVVARSPFART